MKSPTMASIACIVRRAASDGDAEQHVVAPAIAIEHQRPGGLDKGVEGDLSLQRQVRAWGDRCATASSTSPSARPSSGMAVPDGSPAPVVGSSKPASVRARSAGSARRGCGQPGDEVAVGGRGSAAAVPLPASRPWTAMRSSHELRRDQASIRM